MDEAVASEEQFKKGKEPVWGGGGTSSEGLSESGEGGGMLIINSASG
jgi:hypothetical protein